MSQIKNYMNNFNNIVPKKFKRKNFILYFAASAVAAIALLKVPFGFLYPAKKELSDTDRGNSLKVTLNPKAVSRNSKV